MSLEQLIVSVLNHHPATSFLHDEACRDIAGTVVTVLEYRLRHEQITLTRDVALATSAGGLA